ncbi:MAG: WD40/YVTN/BNR-like repeat-containing protein [Saprospiraceae bacterium]
MTNQNIIYLFFIFTFLMTSYGCQQKTAKEGLSISSKAESIKTPKIINQKSSSVEKPAVIYRSNDMGTTWSSFANGIPEDATLSGIKQYDNKIYVTTDYHGLFVSSDGKDNWSSLNFEQLKGLDINCIEVEANKLIIGTLRRGILISIDDGLNWKEPQKNLKDSPIRAFIKSGKKLYAGTDSGIFESIDFGNTWSHVFGQMQILGFTSLDDTIYAATQNGALMCNDNSSNWKSIYEGDALHDIGNDGKYIYAMTIGQQLLKTENDGASWENAQHGIIYPTNFYTNELQHIGNNIFSAQWIGIYHSSNNGDSWKILNGLPDSTAFSTLEITNFGIITGISIR